MVWAVDGWTSNDRLYFTGKLLDGTIRYWMKAVACSLVDRIMVFLILLKSRHHQSPHHHIWYDLKLPLLEAGFHFLLHKPLSCLFPMRGMAFLRCYKSFLIAFCNVCLVSLILQGFFAPNIPRYHLFPVIKTANFFKLWHCNRQKETLSFDNVSFC